MSTETQNMDSRISSILINLDLNVHKKFAQKQYSDSCEGIKQAIKCDNKKTYKNMRSALKECYLTGSLKYGNNFLY